MNLVLELLISLLIVTSAVFMLVGSLGLIKLPDLMTRLHAPTKATTAGVGGALIASMLYFLAVDGTMSIHEVLITLFLFLTAPVTAHFVSKAYLHQQRERAVELPATGRPYGWSTFDGGPTHATQDASRAGDDAARDA